MDIIIIVRKLLFSSLEIRSTSQLEVACNKSSAVILITLFNMFKIKILLSNENIEYFLVNLSLFIYIVLYPK